MGFAEWLIFIAIGLLVLLLLLLVMPLRLRLRWNEKVKSLSLVYLGFTLEYNYTLKLRRLCLGNWIVSSAHWPATSVGKSLTTVTKSPMRTRFERLLKNVREMWHSRLTLRRATLIILRLLGRLIRSWRLERAEVHMAVGLGDPARTGIATGAFWSIWPVLRSRFPNLQLSWQPHFDQPYWEFDADIVLRALPLRLVYHFMRAVVFFPWRELRRLSASLVR